MLLSEVFIINLKRRKDRLNHITEQCRKHGLKIKRIEATDGNIIYKNHPKKRRGFLGCYDSHLSLLGLLNTFNDDYFFIAEDDCIFADNFKERLSNIFFQLPENWDIIYLGGSIKSENSTADFSVNFKKALNVFCTHAYIVRKKAIPALIKKVETRQWKIDILYAEFQKENQCFITIPELAWQKKGFSDIEYKITNNQFLKNLK